MSAASLRDAYNKPGSGLSIARLRDGDLNAQELEILSRSVPEIAVHRRANKPAQAHARYSSDGLYVHADHTFYTMDGLPAKNDGYGVILVVVDVLTRMAFARALKSKSGAETASALDEIFDDYAEVFGRRPDTMQTDKAREFMGTSVRKVLKKSETKLVHSNNQRTGAAVAEAFNRLLRNMISRWFTTSGDVVWVDVLPDLIINYNSRKHSTLRKRLPSGALEPASKALTPLQAVELVKDGQEWMLPTSTLAFTAQKPPELPIGTPVRVREPDPAGLEHKARNWSEGVYLIASVRTETTLKGAAVNLYTLVNPDGSAIKNDGLYGLSSRHKFAVEDLLPSPVAEEAPKAPQRRRKTREEKALDEYRSTIDAVIRGVDASLHKLTDPKSLKEASKAQLEAFLTKGVEPASTVVKTRVSHILQLRALKSKLVNARAEAAERDDIVALRVLQRDAVNSLNSTSQRLAQDRVSRKSRVRDGGPVATSKPLQALEARAEAALKGFD